MICPLYISTAMEALAQVLLVPATAQLAPSACKTPWTLPFILLHKYLKASLGPDEQHEQPGRVQQRQCPGVTAWQDCTRRPGAQEPQH